MTDPSKGINQLEALALLYAGHNDSNSFTFSDYIDTRFEDTFDVKRRASLKALEVNVLGEEVQGIVLDPNAGGLGATGLGTAASEVGNSILALLGMSRPQPTATCRVMVLGDPHTDLLEIPATYGTTEADKAIIKNYPAFVYAPASFPLIPGSFIKCKFDKGTYQSGVVTSMDPTMPPFILGGEAYAPLSSSPDFGQAVNLGSLTNIRPSGSAADVPYILPVGGAEVLTVGSAWINRLDPLPPHKPQFHKALDIGGAVGTPLVAISDGEVRFTRNGTLSDEGGYYIIIKYEDKINGGDLYSRYLHMARPTHLKKGDLVKQGDVVGYMGNTGRSTAPHLHYELGKKYPGIDAKGDKAWGNLGEMLNPVSYYPANSFVNKQGIALV